MPLKCPEKDCWAPEVACNLGGDVADCPHYKNVIKEDNGSNSAHSEFLLPWSGNSMGMVDLQFVAGRSRPILIGVIGAHSAGKTTLLTALYLLLSQGRRVQKRRFAGSYTLGGWENLAHSLRWTPNQGPHFPPHTPNDAGRLPGLLHLAFRRDDDTVEDVLITDAPGEWFERWAIDKDASDLEGARWISRNADAFIFLVDSFALAGADRGESRTSIQILAQRVANELQNRPIAVVWSKTDVQVSKQIRESLTSTFMDLFEDHHETSVTVQGTNKGARVTAESFIDLLSWSLESWSTINSQDLIVSVMNPRDPMLSFRG